MTRSLLSAQKTGTLTTIAMLLLAFYPVLVSYVSSFNLNYGEIAIVLFSLICLTHINVIKTLQLPAGYLVFWLYVAVSLILNSGDFKITYLIPGGVAFFIFSTGIATISIHSCVSLLYKFLKIVFYLSLFIWFFQMLGLMPEQFSNTFILPISDHIGYDEANLEELKELRSDSTRPCSFFLEPAMYAEFLNIFLCFELFYSAGKKKLCTSLSIIVILVMLFLRSGLGVCCMAVLVLAKLIVYFKYASVKNRRYYLLLIPLIFVIAIGIFNSNLGLELFSRTEELSTEGSSGFVRLIQGFLIYNELPLTGKLLGINIDNIEGMNLPFIVYINGQANLFINGFFTLLIRHGLIGLILLVRVYIFLYKSGSLLSRAIIILLLSMSLIEQVYLGPSMFLCTIIAFVSGNKNESRISFPISVV